MMSMDMPALIQWFEAHAGVLAGLVTGAVALFLICCIECGTRPEREEDDLFRRHEL